MTSSNLSSQATTPLFGICNPTHLRVAVHCPSNPPRNPPASSNLLYPSTSHPLSRPNVPNPSPETKKTEPVAGGWLARERTGSLVRPPRWPSPTIALGSNAIVKVCTGVSWIGFCSHKSKEKTKETVLFFNNSWSKHHPTKTDMVHSGTPFSPQKEEKIPILGNVSFQGIFQEVQPTTKCNKMRLCPSTCCRICRYLDFNGLKFLENHLQKVEQPKKDWQTIFTPWKT